MRITNFDKKKLGFFCNRIFYNNIVLCILVSNSFRNKPSELCHIYIKTGTTFKSPKFFWVAIITMLYTHYAHLKLRQLFCLRYVCYVTSRATRNQYFKKQNKTMSYEFEEVHINLRILLFFSVKYL